MRPYIIRHMGTSIDGRLHPSRFTAPATGISSDVLRRHYDKIHDSLRVEGWILGRKIMAELAKGHQRDIADPPIVERQPHVADRNGRNLDIAIDPSGRALIDCKTLEGGVVWLRHQVERAPEPEA